MDRTTHVLYHATCADGFGGAYAAWKALGDDAQYIPVQYGAPMPELPDDAHVAMIDFSYSRDVVEGLAARVASLVILDHHKTAQTALDGLPYATFDMDKSGAVLAWEHFHPGRRVPPLLAYVQDRDLWRWALPRSREVSAGLWSYPLEFALWDRLTVAGLADDGTAILRYMVQQTAMICDQARLGRVGRYVVPVVNATSLWSEVGEELLRRFPDRYFAASYYDTGHGKRKWSLRSRPDFDVSAVAREQGGGGHAQAAGFETEITQPAGAETAIRPRRKKSA